MRTCAFAMFLILSTACSPDTPPRFIAPVPGAERDFDARAYRPVTEGALVASRIVARPAKTVILIPQTHWTPLGIGKETRALQQEVYAILDHLVTQTGRASIVPEGWPVGASVQQRLDDAFALSQKEGGSLTPNAKAMLRVVSVSERAGRHAMALDALDDGGPHAAELFLLTRPELATPVGSVDPAQASADEGSFAAYYEAMRALDRPADIPCRDDLASGVSLAHAASAVEDGSADWGMRECFCAARTEYNPILRHGHEFRSIRTARAELDAALAAPTRVVVLVTGVSHAPETIRLLRATADVSWLLVVPRTLAAEDINYDIPFPAPAIPDLRGACEGRG